MPNFCRQSPKFRSLLQIETVVQIFAHYVVIHTLIAVPSFEFFLVQIFGMASSFALKNEFQRPWV